MRLPPVKSLSSLRLVRFSTATLLLSGLAWGSGLGVEGSSQRAIAQSQPTCQPPRANEYLLLVRNPKADTLDQLRQLLPANAILTPCSYPSGNSTENVVRVEGFATAEVANAWAKFLSDQAGLVAIVSAPAGAVATNPSPPATNPPPASNSGAGSFPRPNTNPNTAPSTTPSTTPNTNSNATFNPQLLGNGFAVLVDYFNRPEVATDVRKVTNRNVGLVSYEQRPYLLATYAADANAVSVVLNKLTENGFVAVVVDSRGVVLLSADVRRN